MEERQRQAMLALACAVEPGTAGLAARLAEHGPEAVLLEHRAQVATTAVAGRLQPDEVPAMLAAMAQRGVRVLVQGDAEFPSQLMDLPEPPLALWMSGPLDLRAAALRSVAIVGSRACTAYGERATAMIGAELAETGWTVVSGGAFGIDAAAHRAALSVGGSTVAILACGVDVAYPRSHDALLARIADTGAVVSELPPGSQALKHRFLNRNRLIAALTRGTVVVEAARRSGALATAGRAQELGRAVLAVPGPITSMASSGTNRLLQEGSARAACAASEVSSVLTDRVPDRAPAGRAEAVVLPGMSVSTADEGAARAGHPDDSALVGDPARVLGALPRRRAASVEEVAARAGLPAVTCLAHLGVLEIGGLVRRTESGWRRCGG
jgi:DNA processing protein